MAKFLILILMLIANPIWVSQCPAQQTEKKDVRYLTFDDVKFEMEKDEEFEREMLTDEINDMVGSTHDRFLVFNHYHGVSFISEIMHHVNELFYISLV